MELIYDYKNGFVIDSETGEVVDQIYVASPTDGMARSSSSDIVDRYHYEGVIRVPNNKYVRKAYIFCRKLLSAFALQDVVSNEELNKTIEYVLDVYRRYAMNIKIDAAAAAAVYLYTMKFLGKAIDIDEICQYIESPCKTVRYIILRISRDIKIDRRNIIALEILSFTRHPEIVSVAMALLRHAKTDGKRSKTVAAALLYTAAIILDKDGRDISQNTIAEHFNISFIAMRKPVLESILPVKIYRFGQGGAVDRIEVPSSICVDIERIAKLSSKVVCI